MEGSAASLYGQRRAGGVAGDRGDGDQPALRVGDAHVVRAKLASGANDARLAAQGTDAAGGKEGNRRLRAGAVGSAGVGKGGEGDRKSVV